MIYKNLIHENDVDVSILGLGGMYLIGDKWDADKPYQLIKYAYENGINYIDTAPQYGDGHSEFNIGFVVEKLGIRDKIHIATKIDKREYYGAKQQFNESLKRLRTDYVDILQIHHYNEDEDEVLFNNGVMDLLLELKAKGQIKNIGLTSHEPKKVDQFMGRSGSDIDTLLLTINPAEAMYKNSFTNNLMNNAYGDYNVGIIAMKLLTHGAIFLSGITSFQDIFNYIMSLPNISCAIVGHCNIDQLKSNIEAANHFSPMGRNDMLEMVSKVADNYELYTSWRKVSHFEDDIPNMEAVL